MYEIFYHPSIGTHQSRPALVNFAGIVAIAAFYTPDDHYRHVIVATSDGNIREVFYHPSIGVHVSNPPLVNLPGVVALGAFYTPDDHYRHVIMGTSGYSGRDPVHADPWDFALDTEAGGATAWVAGDGGVFAFKNPTPYSFIGASWTPQLDGLHGHQMITLSVMQSSPISRSRLAYPTSHNDGWIRSSTWTVLPEPVWDACEAGGDVNWTNGDSSSPRWALLARQQTIATLVHFTATPDRGGITLLNTKLNRDAMGNVNPLPTNIGPGGPLTFQFIQGAKAGGKFTGLDAVMAVDLPLTKPWDKATNTNPILIPGPLAADSKGQPVLIRNKQFDANADINTSGGKGWAIEIPSFPANAMGIFVTGGRAAPVYYTFTGNGELFRWGGASWGTRGTPILTGLGFDANTNGVYGPVFVNPYDARVVFAIAGTAIVRSINGGSTFAPDTALTALVTAGGKHPPTTLRCMAFHYEDPDEIAAGGDAGVFFRTGAGAWRDLTRFLSTPRLPAVAVGIDTEFVYVAENGRSLYGIRGYNNA